MKLFFLGLLIFSTSYFAQAGFVAGSKINQCNVTDYSSPSDCQRLEDEQCFDRGVTGECGVYKLVDTFGGAHKSVEECSGQTECQAILQDKHCLSSQAAFIDANYSIVYCMEKVGKELQVDQALLTQKRTERTQSTLKEAAIQKAIAAMDCGQRVMATMLVQNSTKGLTEMQVGQMVSSYAQVKGLLETGSLVTARGVILNIPADGTLVTEGDKTALVSELDKCKP